MTPEPLRFDEFMRRALYDPVSGYYRQSRHPIGRDGDFFTASQLQPLFGQIVASEAHALCPDAHVFELGPGHSEMSAFFSGHYTALEYGAELPLDLTGFLFGNEFLDALPVRVGTKRHGRFYEMLVQESSWLVGPELDPGLVAYVQRYWPFVPEGGQFEIVCDALTWIDRIGARMESGYALFIDYGYTTPETLRFPQGTLMSYRDHRAIANVLASPGCQDITAHVAFDAIADRAVQRGFEVIHLESLATLVLRVLARHPELGLRAEGPKQLKSLLFGMGETFRCLLLQKSGRK